jgi:hypothetical protein
MNTQTQINTQSDTDEVGRKPDFIAYNVKETKQGKAIFNNIGAAWKHKDQQGFDIQLDSMPVNGRVTLREMRDERMQNYQQQQNEGQGQSHDQVQDQTHEQSRSR